MRMCFLTMFTVIKLKFNVKLRFIAIVLIFSLFGGCSDRELGVSAMVSYDENFMANLQSATDWIVESGITVVAQKGTGVIQSTLIERWSFLHYSQPLVNDEIYIAVFTIQAGLFRNEIINVYRKQIDNYLYEYWVANLTHPSLSQDQFRVKFYVTRAIQPEAEREILLQSDQFINRFNVDGEVFFDFPANDLKVLYQVKPWKFPDHYLGSDLEEVRVEVERSKNGELHYYVQD